MNKFTKILIAGLALFMCQIAIFGQAQTGTLRGTITDPNGGVVAGATVTAKNQATGVASGNVTTNSDGGFSIPNLVPGKYTVTAEQAGFSKKAVTDVSVALGSVSDVTVALAVGAPSETVTVTSAGDEPITRDQAQISTVFETRKIEDLPSNGAGGGLDTLALLAPGVVASRNSGVNTDGVGLSVNGNRGRSNNFQIDGSDNNDLSIGGPSFFVGNQSQVAEYQIITNNFSAQYGRNSGAVVNIITKGGGNDFHGDLFEYHQDNRNLNSLNNKERLEVGRTKPNRSLYNVFGGTVGGPLWTPRFGEGVPAIWKGKDRAFFFFSFQGIRNPSIVQARGGQQSILASEFGRLQSSFPGNAAITNITQLSAFAISHGGQRPRTDIPTNLGGTVSSAFYFGVQPAGCTTRVIAVGTAAPAACATNTYTTFINPATGQPFLTGGPFDVFNLGSATAPNLFQGAFAERDYTAPFTQNEYSIRFTVRPSDRDNVDFRYLTQKSVNVNNGGSSNGFTYDVPATSKNLGGTWVHQFGSALTSEFKATTQNLNVEFGGAGTIFGRGAIPKPANIGDTIANISFAGILSLRGSAALSTIGGATNIPQGRLVKVYQFADTLTWIHGKHNLVFGAEFKHLINKVPFLPLYQGSFAYATGTALARLQNNAPSAISLTAGDPVTTYTENDQYYFVQDDFKIRSNLTLNLGVRYEYTGQPINQLHDITLARESGSPRAIFDPTLPISVRTVPFVKPDKNNFAPRIGFAWSPKFESGFLRTLFGDNGTVIRGGFALAYDPAFYNILLNLQNVAPYSAALSLSSANALASSTTSPFPLALNPTATNLQAIASATNVLPLGKLNPIFLAQTQVSPGFHSPYSEQFSFGIQRQINRGNVFEISYVGTQGVGLFQSVLANPFIRPLVSGFTRTAGTAGVGLGVQTYTFPGFSALLPTGVVAQTCTDDATTLFVNESVCDGRLIRANSITVRDNGAHSTYHSLQTRYSGRFMKNALSVNASYTFSKTIDNASEIFAFADIGSANPQNPFCSGSCEKSVSNLNRPHAFSASFIYDFPFFKDQRGIVGHLLGGWQINATQVATSGNPYTPTDSTNGVYGLGNTYITAGVGGQRAFIGNPNAPQNTVAISAVDAFFTIAGAPQVLPTSTVFYSVNTFNQNGTFVPVSINDVRFIINAPGSARIFGTPFGNSPRNSVHGPAINQLNLSLFKNIKVAERLRVQMRGEAFNVLNHPNPGYGVNAGGFLPSITLNNAGVNNGSFGDNKDIRYARRVVQLGLRIIF